MNKKEKNLLIETISNENTFNDTERLQAYKFIMEGNEESYKDSETLNPLNALSDNDKFNVGVADIKQAASEMDNSLSLTNGLRLARLCILTMEGFFNVFPMILENPEVANQKSSVVKIVKLGLRAVLAPGNIVGRGLRKIVSALEPVAEEIDAALSKENSSSENKEAITVNDSHNHVGDILVERWNRLAGTK